jgi:hypothetical protein
MIHYFIQSAYFSLSVIEKLRVVAKSPVERG